MNPRFVFELVKDNKTLSAAFSSSKIINQDPPPAQCWTSQAFLCLWLVLCVSNMNKKCVSVCVCACVHVCMCDTHSSPTAWPCVCLWAGSSGKWKFTVSHVGTWVVCHSLAASNLYFGFNCLEPKGAGPPASSTSCDPCRQNGIQFRGMVTAEREELYT